MAKAKKQRKCSGGNGVVSKKKIEEFLDDQELENGRKFRMLCFEMILLDKKAGKVLILKEIKARAQRKFLREARRVAGAKFNCAMLGGNGCCD